MRFLVDRWKYGFEAWEESEMARWLLIVSRVEEAMAPTPVLLPGESQGRGSLVGCRPWGRTESDTTERLSSSNSVACTVRKAPRVLGTEHIGSVR